MNGGENLNKINKIVGLFGIFVMFSGYLTLAANEQYAYSRVRYTVPTIYQFTVDMPGYAAGTGNISNQVFPGNNTDEIWFNASTPNSKNIAPCRSPGVSCQVSFTAPILNFTNTGTTAFNISIRLDTAQDATLVTWANFSYPVGSGPAACSAATLATNSSVITQIPINFTKALCINNVTSIFMWTNFTAAPSGTISNYLNYTSFIT